MYRARSPYARCKTTGLQQKPLRFRRRLSSLDRGRAPSFPGTWSHGPVRASKRRRHEFAKSLLYLAPAHRPHGTFSAHRRHEPSQRVADHQHRAIGVAHDVAGIGAEKIASHPRAMRAHNDEVGVHRLRLLQHLVIDAALTDGRADLARAEAALLS